MQAMERHPQEVVSGGVTVLQSEGGEGRIQRHLVPAPSQMTPAESQMGGGALRVQSQRLAEALSALFPLTQGQLRLPPVEVQLRVPLAGLSGAGQMFQGQQGIPLGQGLTRQEALHTGGVPVALADQPAQLVPFAVGQFHRRRWRLPLLFRQPAGLPLSFLPFFLQFPQFLPGLRLHPVPVGKEGVERLPRLGGPAQGAEGGDEMNRETRLLRGCLGQFFQQGEGVQVEVGVHVGAGQIVIKLLHRFGDGGLLVIVGFGDVPQRHQLPDRLATCHGIML